MSIPISGFVFFCSSVVILGNSKKRERKTAKTVVFSISSLFIAYRTCKSGFIIHTDTRDADRLAISSQGFHPPE
jgi:hypothetical protein